VFQRRAGMSMADDPAGSCADRSASSRVTVEAAIKYNLDDAHEP
jgi:hypothetical protein